MSQESLFVDAPPLTADDERLVEAYAEVGRTLDDLFYTNDFDDLYRRVRESGDKRDRQEIAHRLLNLRKAARLPRLGRGETAPISVNREFEEFLRSMVEGEMRGSMGQRDKLLYTPDFDTIVKNFNHSTGLNLDKHAIWRLIAKLAK